MTITYATERPDMDTSLDSYLSKISAKGKAWGNYLSTREEYEAAAYAYDVAAAADRFRTVMQDRKNEKDVA